MRLSLVDDSLALGRLSHTAIRQTQTRFATFGGIILLTATSIAQTAISNEIRPRSFIRALRVEQAPRIDGILDEACWQTAEPMTNFTQVLPVEGAAASERTEVRSLAAAPSTGRT